MLHSSSGFVIIKYNINFMDESEEWAMLYEKSCGALVYRKHHGNIELLLIRNVNGGRWSFPKGHVESGETEQQTAMREILEETGIQAVLEGDFRQVITYAPKKNITKDVVYFLARATTFDYTPQKNEVSKIKWVEINNTNTMLSYENDRQLVNKAKHIIK